MDIGEITRVLGPVFRTAVRFGIVGLSSVGVYFICLALLRPVVTPVALLAASAYVLSAVFNYLAQSRFTFGSRTSDRTAMGRYVVMHMICITINSGLMYLLVDRWTYNLWLSQIAVTAVVAATSFALSYLWVYRTA